MNAFDDQEMGASVEPGSDAGQDGFLVDWGSERGRRQKLIDFAELERARVLDSQEGMQKVELFNNRIGAVSAAVVEFVRLETHTHFTSLSARWSVSGPRMGIIIC